MARIVPSRHIGTWRVAAAGHRSATLGHMLLDPEDELSDVLTIAQAAAVVGREPATVRDWIRRGYLTPMRIGRRTYVTGRAVRQAEAEVWKRTPRPAQPAT